MRLKITYFCANFISRLWEISYCHMTVTFHSCHITDRLKREYSLVPNGLVQAFRHCKDWSYFLNKRLHWVAWAIVWRQIGGREASVLSSLMALSQSKELLCVAQTALVVALRDKCEAKQCDKQFSFLQMTVTKGPLGNQKIPQSDWSSKECRWGLMQGFQHA